MATILVSDTNLTNIANAIREKNGKTTSYKVDEMASAINNLSEAGSGDSGGGVETTSMDVMDYAWNMWPSTYSTFEIFATVYENGEIKTNKTTFTGDGTGGSGVYIENVVVGSSLIVTSNLGFSSSEDYGGADGDSEKIYTSSDVLIFKIASGETCVYVIGNFERT